MFAMKWYCLCSNCQDEQLAGEFEHIVLQVWNVRTEKSENISSQIQLSRYSVRHYTVRAVEFLYLGT
jgi:hypothetical protein